MNKVNKFVNHKKLLISDEKRYNIKEAIYNLVSLFYLSIWT